MKTCVLAALLACLCLPGRAATWNTFSEPDSYESVTVFDSDSVVRSGDRVTVLFDFLRDAEKEPDDPIYRRSVHLLFDCKARTIEELDTAYTRRDGRLTSKFGGDHKVYTVQRLGSTPAWLDTACAPTFPAPQPHGNFSRIPANDPDAYALAFFEGARTEFRGMRQGPPRDPPAARVDCAGTVFKFGTSLKELPPEVLNILKHDGRVADHGEAFNPTDVISENVPQRRLASAAVGEQRTFVAVEHGGIGYNVEVWAFERQAGHWDGKQRWLVFQPPATLPALLSTTCKQNTPTPRTDRPVRPRISCSIDASRSIYMSYADSELSLSFMLDRRAVARGIARAGRVRHSTDDREPSPDEAAELSSLLDTGRKSPDNQCPDYALDEFMRALAGHDQPSSSAQSPAQTTARSARAAPADDALREAKDAEARGDGTAERAALDRACALGGSAQAFAMRANLLARSEYRKAIADLDAALLLDPTLTDARHLRAWLRFNNEAQGAERALAVQDLAILDKQLPPDAPERMSMAFIYQRFDMPAQEISQWDQWIPVHGGDSAIVSAYGGRCWARVVLNIELARALADCNQAIAINDQRGELNGEPFEHRGWLWLRLGHPANALADFDHVLQRDTDNCWALYGRGVSHRQLGQNAAAKADFAKARGRILNIDSLMEKAGMTFKPGAAPAPWRHP